MGKKFILRFIQIFLIITLASCFHEDQNTVTKKMHEYLDKNKIDSYMISSVSLQEFSANNEWFPHIWTGVVLSSKHDGFWFNVYYDENKKIVSDNYRQKFIGLKKSLYEIDTLGSSLDFVKRSINESFNNGYLNYECKIIFLNDYEVALEFYVVKSIDQSNKDVEVKRFMNNFNNMKLDLIKVSKLTVKYFSENQFVKSEVENSLESHLMYYGNQCGLLFLEEKDFINLNDSIIIKNTKLFNCKP